MGLKYVVVLITYTLDVCFTLKKHDLGIINLGRQADCLGKGVQHRLTVGNYFNRQELQRGP